MNARIKAVSEAVECDSGKALRFIFQRGLRLQEEALVK